MAEIKLKIASVVIGSGEGGGGVAPYYADLPDKPSINGETLSGDMTSEDLGLASSEQSVPSGGTTGQVLAKKSNADNDVQWVNQESGGQGTTNYADLENKPKINNVTLSGNKNAAQLGLQPELVSGTNIKTVNGESLLGIGNITIEGGGTDDYTQLSNKPSINSHTLSGNQTAAQLGLASAEQGVPSGGSVGQVLKKTSSGAAWQNESGGTQVVANPSGTATQQLNTVQIGETIYTNPKGDNGITPSIDPDTKHWMIGETDTEINAEGQDGADGSDGADAVNPFKGWWPDIATLIAAIEATPGDYAYVIPTDPNDPVEIWEYDSTDDGTNNYWHDSGRTFNPSNNQSFASGENLNETHITNDDISKASALPTCKALSVKAFQSADLDAELGLSDEGGNIIVEFGGGHIRTKNFDSSDIGGNVVGKLPSYWKTYLDAKLDAIHSAELSLGRNGSSFIFITDTHWNDNYKKSPAIIKYLLDNTDIEDVICGGDVIVGHGERTPKMAEMMDFAGRFKYIPAEFLVGNHDYNTSDQPKTDWANRITPEEHYRMCIAMSERNTTYDQTDDTYVSESGYSFNEGRYPEYFGIKDIESQKIRYIFLDSTCVHKSVQDGMTDNHLRISDAQLEWMQDRIEELEAGWTVLVFSHIGISNSPNANNGFWPVGEQIRDAIDEIYDDVNATIAGVICGHCHKDLNYLSTAKGYPFISTTCDARKQSQAGNDPNGYSSDGGDTDEQAFDIYFLNTSLHTITTIRIGAGLQQNQSRTFTYLN